MFSGTDSVVIALCVWAALNTSLALWPLLLLRSCCNGPTLLISAALSSASLFSMTLKCGDRRPSLPPNLFAAATTVFIVASAASNPFPQLCSLSFRCVHRLSVSFSLSVCDVTIFSLYHSPDLSFSFSLFSRLSFLPLAAVAVLLAAIPFK